jgi:hypothetical protein
VKESLYESERLNGTTRLAMCIECGRMFTSDTNFDRHRMGVEDRYCVDPATKGLELDDRGFWKRPGDARSDLRVRNLRHAGGGA